MLCGSQRARLLNLSAAGSSDRTAPGGGAQGAVPWRPEPRTVPGGGAQGAVPWRPEAPGALGARARLLPLVATEVSPVTAECPREGARSLLSVPERVRGHC